MRQTAYYGYPISKILFRAIIFIILILFIIVSIFLLISIYLIVLLSVLSILIYIYWGIIFFKKNFQNYRMLILKKMIKNADLKGNETILDIGTGAGIIAIGFAKILKNGKVYGIDIYKHKYNNYKEFLISKIRINFFGNTLKNAQKNAKIELVDDKCKFITADITAKLDFPEKFFDIILSSQFWYCIPIKKHDQTFQNIDRILKTNGKIIFFEPISFFKWDINNLKKYFEKNGYNIRILRNKKFKRGCIFIGVKIKSNK